MRGEKGEQGRTGEHVSFFDQLSVMQTFKIFYCTFLNSCIVYVYNVQINIKQKKNVITSLKNGPCLFLFYIAR